MEGADLHKQRSKLSVGQIDGGLPRVRGVLPEAAVTTRSELRPGDYWIELTDQTRIHARALPAILSSTKPGTWPPGDLEVSQGRAEDRERVRRWLRVWPQATEAQRMQAVWDAEGEAEVKASKHLGVDPIALALAALRLWGRSLTNERDERVTAEAPAGASARTVQALRGHVTRQLLAEIQPLVVKATATKGRKK